MRSVALLRIAGVLIVAASVVEAQTTTADGVNAFLRGDYPRAVQILKPIAESPWQPGDRVAEFFMATLYENGLGIAGDPVRACALYTRSLFDPANPFGEQAMELLKSLQRSLGPESNQRCLRIASIGFDHGFQPATFALELGQSIVIELDSATVSYEGNSKRTDLGFMRSGVRFLSIEHTELRTGDAQSSRRHFIELFTWTPANPVTRTWVLMWQVFEVIRADLISVTAAPLTTISAESPPTDPYTLDLHALARLRVNDIGEVEWAVLSGAHQGRGVIESDADRQAKLAEARARQEADARVDWTRVSDMHRAPTLNFIGAAGCGDVFVYGWSDDRAEAISIWAKKEALDLSTGARTFNLASHHADLEVVVHVYARAIRSWPFCTDAPMFSPEEKWRVVRGTMTIELSPPGSNQRAPYEYRATIRIVGAEFVSATGVRVRQIQPITLSAAVGSMFG